jgi:branched-chain amino acid transport system permease protein
MFIQLVFNGLITGLLYSVIAFGFSLVYNSSKIFHIAYAGLITVAPYLFLWARDHTILSTPIALLFSITATAVLSLLIYRLVYKALLDKRSSGLTLMLSSIGVLTVITNIIAALAGTKLRGFGGAIDASKTFSGFYITNTQTIQLPICLAVAVLLALLIGKTRYGFVLRAVGENDALCSTLGTNISRILSYTFILSGALAAVGGLLYANVNGIEPYSGTPLMLMGVTALIVGGINNYTSPLLGGIIIGILQSLIAGYLSATWQSALVYLILILFLMFMPNGLIGIGERKA